MRATKIQLSYFQLLLLDVILILILILIYNYLLCTCQRYRHPSAVRITQAVPPVVTRRGMSESGVWMIVLPRPPGAPSDGRALLSAPPWRILEVLDRRHVPIELAEPSPISQDHPSRNRS